MKETLIISADLSCRESAPAVCAKQGDSGAREVVVRFLSGDSLFDISDAESAEMRVLRPDGYLSIIDGTIDHEESSASFTFTEQSLNAGGEGRLEFVLYGSGGEVISSAPARLFVIPRGVGDPAAVSTNEYLEFKRLLTRFVNSFVIMSREEYEEITPSPDTVYFVYDESGAVVYFRTVSIGDSIHPLSTAILTAPVPALVTHCTPVQEE